ncbi:MAG: PAS domain-containing sensor histidine kinase [Alphaproteobacteria bacterium]
MGQQGQIKLSYASKLTLAAMTLLLPLIVFVFILVDDRNAQIRAARNEVAGLEYLVELRHLFELAPRHRALVQLARRDDRESSSRIEEIEAAIDAGIEALLERAEISGDPFRVSEPFARLHAVWTNVKRIRRAGDAATTENPHQGIERELVDLNRHLGNTSNLAVDSGLESTHLIDLVVIELPQMIARVSEARSRALNILESGREPTLRDRQLLSIDDWALQTAHDNLFYGFNIAVGEDGEIARNLTRQFEDFDRDTNKFHHFIASGDFNRPPGEVFALGTSSIEASLRLYDQILPELRRVLVKRMRDLESTKLIAIASVIAASIIAGLSGWLLLRGLTGPLQTEVAERRRVQARLRDLAAIVEQAEDSILTLSTTGELTSWNKGAERLYGYTAEEIIGNDVSILSPEGFEHETTQLMKAMMSGAPTPTRETIRVRKDGELVDVSLRFSLIRSQDGHIRGAAVIARDIRERKKAQAEIFNKEKMLQTRIDQLHETQEELQQHRDRLEDKVRERTAEVREQAAQLETALEKEKDFSALQRKFVSMASHEFRTPLAIIDGAAQRVERRIDIIEAPELEKRLSRIRGAVRRMLALIESTLSASRLDEGHVELRSQMMDLAELVRNVCERQAELSDEVDIHLDLEDLPDAVEADAALLDQVFTNLLSNAVKYTPNTPRISVIGAREADGFLTIAIADNGIGIPKDELSRLFDRFFRATTSEGIAGTGIGLNLASELVEMHGGNITVESNVGVGTTFTVRLPERRPDARGDSSSPLDVNAAA